MTSGAAQPAFRAIFESEYGYIRNSVVRLGIRSADVADVVHDVFLVVHEKLPEFDATRPLRPWLFGITFRVAIGVKRRLAYRMERVVSGEGDEQVFSARASSWPSPEQVASTEECRTLLARAMEALDDPKRAVFVLHDLDGVAIPEVAEALEIPLNTAYSRLRLAREALRTELTSHGFAPGAA